MPREDGERIRLGLRDADTEAVGVGVWEGEGGIRDVTEEQKAAVDRAGYKVRFSKSADTENPTFGWHWLKVEDDALTLSQSFRTEVRAYEDCYRRNVRAH